MRSVALMGTVLVLSSTGGMAEARQPGAPDPGSKPACRQVGSELAKRSILSSAISQTILTSARSSDADKARAGTDITTSAANLALGFQVERAFAGYSSAPTVSLRSVSVDDLAARSRACLKAHPVDARAVQSPRGWMLPPAGAPQAGFAVDRTSLRDIEGARQITILRRSPMPNDTTWWRDTYLVRCGTPLAYSARLSANNYVDASGVISLGAGLQRGSEGFQGPMALTPVVELACKGAGGLAGWRPAPDETAAIKALIAAR
jgi:hypothetical protein